MKKKIIIIQLIIKVKLHSNIPFNFINSLLTKSYLANIKLKLFFESN
jgi:hypothetical protein